MEITPDTVVVLTFNGIALNATIVWTWVVMLVLVLVSILSTRNIRDDLAPPRWQTMLEVIVEEMRTQIRDISQQTRAERAREEFITQVSHELRTPLTNIRLYAELLEARLSEADGKTRDQLSVIRSESERLSRLFA